VRSEITGKSTSRILILTVFFAPTVVVVFWTLILIWRSPHLLLGPQGALGPVYHATVTLLFAVLFHAAAQALADGRASTAARANVVTVFLKKIGSLVARIYRANRSI
jgi:hypothetical protein